MFVLDIEGTTLWNPIPTCPYKPSNWDCAFTAVADIPMMLAESIAN
jgi:hypothetical protein